MMIRTRPAIEADKPFLSWLEVACMREYAVKLWGAAWRPNTPDDGPGLGGCRIIVEGEESVGCVKTTARPDHLWLDQLYIAPGHQGKGLGSAVLRMVLAEAAAVGRPLRLSVLATNPVLRFYMRHGLHLYDETPERKLMTT